jgi:YVTN family beta-propeller protein
MKQIRLLFFMLLLSQYATAAVPRTLWVENSTGRTLSLLDLENDKIENDVLQLGLYPNQIVVWQNKIYALCSGTAEIMVIDPQKKVVEERIALPMGSNPYEMAFVGATRCYVTLSLANSVAVVDVKQKAVIEQIPVGTAPQGLLVEDQTAFVTNTGLRGWSDYTQGSVSLIDTGSDSVIVEIDVPTNPQAVVAAPDYRYYVLCTGDYAQQPGVLAAMSLYDANWNYHPAVVDTFLIGGAPGDLVCTGSGKIYMVDWGDTRGGRLYKFDVFSGELERGTANPLRVIQGATRLCYDRVMEDLYISGFIDGVVQRFDLQTDTIEQSYGFGDGAQDIAILEAISDTDPWADEVIAFSPGENWSGFGANHFPYNVLGPPTRDAAVSEYNPSYKASDILSLGYGGEIILRFDNNIVCDGEGADFLVFENCFISWFSPRPVVEPAIVAVSQDGEHWMTFPFDTTTLQGLAGVTPVRSTQYPTVPDSSGADGFDLADLPVDWIRYIRLTDIGNNWRSSEKHRDFDLDAVVAVNSRPDVASGVADPLPMPQAFPLVQNYPNPFNPRTTIKVDLQQSGRLRIDIHNLAGQHVVQLFDEQVQPGPAAVIWHGDDAFHQPVPSGLYLARIFMNGDCHTLKMTLLR